MSTNSNRRSITAISIYVSVTRMILKSVCEFTSPPTSDIRARLSLGTWDGTRMSVPRRRSCNNEVDPASAGHPCGQQAIGFVVGSSTYAVQNEYGGGDSKAVARSRKGPLTSSCKASCTRHEPNSPNPRSGAPYHQQRCHGLASDLFATSTKAVLIRCPAADDGRVKKAIEDLDQTWAEDWSSAVRR